MRIFVKLARRYEREGYATRRDVHLKTLFRGKIQKNNRQETRQSEVRLEASQVLDSPIARFTISRTRRIVSSTRGASRRRLPGIASTGISARCSTVGWATGWISRVVSSSRARGRTLGTPSVGRSQDKTFDVGKHRLTCILKVPSCQL